MWKWTRPFVSVLVSAIPQPKPIMFPAENCGGFFRLQCSPALNPTLKLKHKNHLFFLQFVSVWWLLLSLNSKFLPLFPVCMINLSLSLKYSGLSLCHVCVDNLPWPRGHRFCAWLSLLRLTAQTASEWKKTSQQGLWFVTFSWKILLMIHTLPMGMYCYPSYTR